MLELFDESVAPHYMMGRKPGMFPSFSDAYAEGEGYPHPVPFDLYDPFGSLRKRMDTEEKRARGRLIEINNGRAAMLGIFGFMSASKVPGSVPVLTFIPPYDGNYMIPFEGNFHMPSMGRWAADGRWAGAVKGARCTSFFWRVGVGASRRAAASGPWHCTMHSTSRECVESSTAEARRVALWSKHSPVGASGSPQPYSLFTTSGRCAFRAAVTLEWLKPRLLHAARRRNPWCSTTQYTAQRNGIELMGPSSPSPTAADPCHHRKGNADG